MKYACYCMTRNIYHKLEPSLNSLLMHSDVDKVFLLTEDDDVGFELPSKVSIVNVRDQAYFDPAGPNYGCSWTWMVLMRTALPKVFPNIDTILSLDLDTIIEDDISELWDTPLGDNYLAGCPEVHKSNGDLVYINGGVVLWNLKQLRKDGKCDEIIKSLNTRKWEFPDQEVVSHLCRGRIYHLNSMYNACNYTAPTKCPKIYHFAAVGGWYDRHPLVQKYKERVEE